MTPYTKICVSVYLDDLKEIDAKVDALKAKGVRGMSRSRLLTIAAKLLDADSVRVAETGTIDTAKVVEVVEQRVATLRADEETEVSRYKCECQVCGATFWSRSRTNRPKQCRPCAEAKRHKRAA